MDRVSSSMKQVPNPLPKVLGRRAGGGGLEAERESFERAQTVSINKAINAQEVAVKEKHARNILPKVGRETSRRGSAAGAAQERGSSKVACGGGVGVLRVPG
ncbi:huntingtin-interacting protein 1-like [Ara ararauna]